MIYTRPAMGVDWNRPALLELRLIVNILGFGTSVIAKLVKSNIKRNLFFTIKDRVVEEQIINGIVHRRQQKVKVYGFDSSKNGRAELFELVADRVSFHKDKVIDARIHEELCALRMTPKGKIDHPVGGHDDLVIAWALALYVLYRGGDIANEFGITRHAIKTDSDIDQEIYDITKDDVELISDKIDIVDSDEADIEGQLKTLESAPGKLSYGEWVQSEVIANQKAMEKILSTKTGREAYMKQYHIDPEYVDDNISLVDMRQSITDFYSDGEESYSTGAGNLYSAFMKVMGVR